MWEGEKSRLRKDQVALQQHAAPTRRVSASQPPNISGTAGKKTRWRHSRIINTDKANSTSKNSGLQVTTSSDIRRCCRLIIPQQLMGCMHMVVWAARHPKPPKSHHQCRIYSCYGYSVLWGTSTNPAPTHPDLLKSGVPLSRSGTSPGTAVTEAR